MGDDDDAATKIEEVPAFARDATEQQDDNGDVFSDAGPGEAVASPPPAQTGVGEMPTELRPMTEEDMRELRGDEDTQNVSTAMATDDEADDGADESAKTRADPVESISLGSLAESEDDGGDVFSDSGEEDG